ncbi:hypothetical protein MUA68_05605 [Staphylococcus aureus]|nr:hypothetical protein MUA68_05605 [Staphylococcus aureus]WRN54308.1 hypothetical protein UM630_03455 [Staphylococcus aureus]
MDGYGRIRGRYCQRDI